MAYRLLNHEEMDSAHRLWVEDRRPKVTPVDFAYAFGTALGDFLSHRLDFEWFILSHEQGEDYCLKANNGWETYPVQCVWKRVNPNGPDASNEDFSFFRRLVGHVVG